MAGVTAEAAARFVAINSGSGSGWDSGNGSGWDSGNGWGWGSGNGWGSDDGLGLVDGWNLAIATFCGNRIENIDDVPTILRSVHGNIAKGDILRNDLTLKSCYIVKGGGFFAHGKTIRDAQAALEAKIMEEMPVEEKIGRFIENFKPGKKYLARDFYNWHHTLTGSCEMGRDEFARTHGIDIDRDEMTPEEFIRLTENAYGGEVIRQLKARIQEMK